MRCPHLASNLTALKQLNMRNLMGFDGFCIQTAQKSHHMWPHPALLSNGVGGTMLLMGRCWCNAGDSDDISVIRINVMTRMLQMSWILMILILMMMKWMYDDVWLCMIMYDDVCITTHYDHKSVCRSVFSASWPRSQPKVSTPRFQVLQHGVW